jgi:hypothetical protein
MVKSYRKPLLASMEDLEVLKRAMFKNLIRTILENQSNTKRAKSGCIIEKVTQLCPIVNVIDVQMSEIAQ